MATSSAVNQVRLGGKALISMAKKVVEKPDGLNEKLTVTYTVDGSNCNLYIVRARVSKTGPVNRVAFKLFDHTCSDFSIYFQVKRVENDNLLELTQSSFENKAAMKLEQSYETSNPYGEIRRTYVHLYGSGNVGGLLVKELKIKKGDERPFKVTLRHYYAATKGNVFSPNRVDIGLSLVLNIQVSNNELDCIVGGLDEHPSSALFYMFEQVIKTRSWKIMSCPHCASIQWQRNGIYLPSETEDDNDNPGKPRLQGSKGNSLSFLANEGSIVGNGNGNIIVRGGLVMGRR